MLKSALDGKSSADCLFAAARSNCVFVPPDSSRQLPRRGRGSNCQSQAIFFLAALGGVALYTMFHGKVRPLPIPFMLGDGALTGLVLLLFTLYGKP